MTDWQEEITALEDETIRAFLARDVESLDAMWSESLLVNSPINRVHDKRTVLDLLGKGVIAHHALHARPETMRRDGDNVVVMGSDFVQDTPDSPTRERRYTNVWRLESGRWKLVIRHATFVAR